MRSIIVLAALVLSGCATHNPYVLDAGSGTIEGCKYLGSVTGTSSWGPLMAPAGMSNAKNEARDNAANLSANRVIWTQISVYYPWFVSGDAFKCD